MTRRPVTILRPLLAGAVALGAVLLPSAAQAATDGTIQVSPDGTVFTREFSGLLAGSVLVPRDSAEDTFFVRNVSNSDGYVRIGLADVDTSDPLLANTASVEIVAAGRTWQRTPLAAAAPCVQLVYGLPLAAGQTAAVTARLLLGDLTGLQAQDETLDFQLQFVMTAEAGDPDETACVVPPPGTPTTPTPTRAPTESAGPPGLSATGGALPLLGIAACVGLVASGIAIVDRRRKRDVR